MRDDAWNRMGRRGRLAMLRESLIAVGADRPTEQIDSIMRRVDEHFATRAMTDPIEATNILLRESWREDHGDTVEWDRAARAQLNEQIVAGVRSRVN